MSSVEPRGGRVADVGRYSRGAWERSKAEAEASQPLPPPRHAAAGVVATLVSGVAEMSLRGYSDREVDVTVAALRAAGFGVWRSNSSGTKSGNAAGYRYFTVRVPEGPA